MWKRWTVGHARSVVAEWESTWSSAERTTLLENVTAVGVMEWPLSWYEFGKVQVPIYVLVG